MTLTPKLATAVVELAFANVAIAHTERFAAEQRNGFARADALLAKLDRTVADGGGA